MNFKNIFTMCLVCIPFAVQQDPRLAFDKVPHALLGQLVLGVLVEVSEVHSLRVLLLLQHETSQGEVVEGIGVDEHPAQFLVPDVLEDVVRKEVEPATTNICLFFLEKTILFYSKVRH